MYYTLSTILIAHDAALALVNEDEHWRFMKQKCCKYAREGIKWTVGDWLIQSNIMNLLYLSNFLLLLEISISQAFRFSGYQSGSSGSLFTYRSPGSRINNSYRNNYNNYWHFRGHGNSYPASSQPKPSSFQPSQPDFSTNTR